MKRGRNILLDDKKRKIKKTILIIMSIAILVGLSVYLITTWIKNKPETIDKDFVDTYFERLTLKNIGNFEDSTLNKDHYNGEKNACGYFYKNGKITVQTLSDEIKILFTIDKMLTCYYKNPNLKGCGIKLNSTKKQFSVPNYEVAKYMKLIFGEDVKYNDKSSKMEFGNIDNLTYKGDSYFFKQHNTAGDNANEVSKNYIQKIIKTDPNKNETTVTKAVAYFEETKNFLTNEEEIIIYRFDNKNELLESETKNVDDYLEKDTAPKYKLIFGKHSDGGYIFKSIEPLN